MVKLTNVNNAQTFREARNFLICALFSVQTTVSTKFWVPNSVTNLRESWEVGLIQLNLSLQFLSTSPSTLAFSSAPKEILQKALSSKSKKNKSKQSKTSACFPAPQQLNQGTLHCSSLCHYRVCGKPTVNQKVSCQFHYLNSLCSIF